MDQEEFENLVERLENFARKNPTAYKVRVGALAALGYAYLFVVIVLLLLIVYFVLVYGMINVLIVKVIWIPLALVAVVVRSLWIRFPSPEGHHLSQGDAPALFDLVKEIEQAVESPHVHHILLTNDFNAAVVQVPRLGIFGWQKNYLVVGLPLMHALSPEQFRAVMAHELGHLSGNHGRFTGWIYRVRLTWIQIMTRLQQQRRRGSFIFDRFLNWYAPFFNAYSFVLARSQEREADLCSVELAGKEHAATALISLEVKGRFLSQEFWPKLLRQANEQADPPPDGFAQMLNALKQQVTPEATQKWFTQAIVVRTGHEDTHPSLADRLKAMGYQAPSQSETGDEPLQQLSQLAVTVGPTAAQYYLGPLAESFNNSFNRAWSEQIKQGWQERHRHLREAKKNLEKLEAKAERQTLSLDEVWTQARLVAETRGLTEALPLIHQILDTQPEHTGANFALGQILLESNDEAGIQYLEKAMAKDIRSVISGCEFIYFFLKERGREKEAEAYRKRAQHHYEALELGQQERRTIYPKDKFEQHGLDSAEIERLRQALSYDPDIRTAYFVRKVVKYFPEEPFYILGIVPYYRWYQFRSAKAEKELVQHLASSLEFPGQTLVVALERNRKHLRRVFRQIDGAKIYSR